MDNQFQLSILKEINKLNNGKNFMISPLSIYHILSLTANGAKNDTLIGMLTALCHKTKEEMNNENKKISSTISKFSSIELANAIFTRFTPLPQFFEIIKEYQAMVDKLESAEKVNKWVSDQTHKLIPKIIDRLSPNDKMILVNAIYFKGIWLHVFDKNKNNKNKFYNFNKEPKKVIFMNIEENFLYFENDEIQSIILKYKTDSLSALVILPKKEKDINKFIENFNQEKYDFILKTAFEKKVILHLPKFEISYEITLNNILKSLGMSQAFSEEKADFSDLKEENDIYINQVIHKTYIQVDEKGTKAAAATAVKMKTKGFIAQEVTEMLVDHPFLFIIKSDELPYEHDMLFISKIESL